MTKLYQNPSGVSTALRWVIRTFGVVSTATTSTRHGSSGGRFCMNACALRTILRNFPEWTLCSGYPYAPEVRAFTSTKTTSSPSWQMRSISPNGDLYWRAKTRYPCRARWSATCSSTIVPNRRLGSGIVTSSVAVENTCASVRAPPRGASWTARPCVHSVQERPSKQERQSAKANTRNANRTGGCAHS